MWTSNVEHLMGEKNKNRQYFEYKMFKFMPFKFYNKCMSLHFCMGQNIGL